MWTPLIAAKHNVAVAVDDPLLLMVTLHQGFVADHEKLMARHARALAAFMERTGDRTEEAVSKALAVLRDEALEGALRHTLARIAEEAGLVAGVMNRLEAASNRLVRRLAWLAALTWIAAALTVGVVLYVLAL